MFPDFKNFFDYLSLREYATRYVVSRAIPAFAVVKRPFGPMCAPEHVERLLWSLLLDLLPL